MVLGRPHLGDTAILMGDGVSLVIDPATADRLDDREMDFDIRNDQLVFT
jgi:Fe-S cluster assembly iron-binding protein IscA